MNSTGSYGPILNFITLNLYERLVVSYPIWSGWIRRRLPCFREKIRGETKHIIREPSAVIECERGVPPSSKNGSVVPFVTRIDSVINYVVSSPNIRKLLAVSNHDYLPHEFEAVRIEEDVYFKLIHVETTEDGNPKNVRFQIFCYDGNIQRLQSFVDSCNRDYERKMLNKLGNNLFFFDQIVQDKNKKKTLQNQLPREFLVYGKHRFHTTRTFDNVYFEGQEHVRRRVEFFLNNRTWYEKKGIPYTLGFLFHGAPGTGKTSEIKAIANIAHRHPINIQLSEIKTKSQLRHLFFNDEIHVWNGSTLEKYTIPVNERLYIIEDADAMGDVLLRREWKNPTIKKRSPTDEFLNPEDQDALEEPIDLSFLLNLLDGTLESSGRILIVTSNFPERFDRALIRPGRIDMIVEFKKCSIKIVKDMVVGFYGNTCTLPSNVHELLQDIEEDKWTPAEVQQILFQNFDDPLSAINDLITTQPQRLAQTEETQVLATQPEPKSQLSNQSSLPVSETGSTTLNQILESSK